MDKYAQEGTPGNTQIHGYTTSGLTSRSRVSRDIKPNVKPLMSPAISTRTATTLQYNVNISSRSSGVCRDPPYGLALETVKPEASSMSRADAMLQVQSFPVKDAIITKGSSSYRSTLYARHKSTHCLSGLDLNTDGKATRVVRAVVSNHELPVCSLTHSVAGAEIPVNNFLQARAGSTATNQSSKWRLRSSTFVIDALPPSELALPLASCLLAGRVRPVYDFLVSQTLRQY